MQKLHEMPVLLIKWLLSGYWCVHACTCTYIIKNENFLSKYKKTTLRPKMASETPTVFKGSEANDVLEKFRRFGVFVDGKPPVEISHLIPHDVNHDDITGWGTYRMCDGCNQAITLDEDYYQCVSCGVDDFDVCALCHMMGSKHNPSHKFERKCEKSN